MRSRPSRVRHAEPADHAVIRDILRTAYGQYTPTSRPRCGSRTSPTYSTSTGTPATGSSWSRSSTSAIAGYAAFYPDASVQGLGWPPAGPVAAASRWIPTSGATASPRRCWPSWNDRARAAGAAVFAFHTSAFMTTAVALYERLGYCRAPRFDIDVNAHYGVTAAARPWPALAYLRRLTARPAARSAA